MDCLDLCPYERQLVQINLDQIGIDGDWLWKSCTICCVWFGLICFPIKGNLFNSPSIDLVKIRIDRDWLQQSHAMCYGLFGFLCVPAKGNLLNSQSIDLVQIGIDTVWIANKIKHILSCLG